MKSSTLVLTIAALSAIATTHASAAAFTAGNIVVYRLGDGTTALTNNGSAVFLDEYTSTGTLVQSIAMPTTATGGNNALIGAGTDASGMINLSTDGQSLTLVGYGTTLGGSTNLTTSSSSSIPRVIGVVSYNGTVNTSTAVSFGSGNPIRAAATTNGTDLWITGGSGGIAYTTTGSTTYTQLNTTANWRDLTITGNQLYATTGSGTAYRVASVGTGTPTTSGATLTELPGIDNTNVTSPYAMAMLDRDATVAGNDTLYLVDGSKVSKFSLISGTWTANGSIAVAGNLYGLTATTDAQGHVILYATTALTTSTGGGAIYSITDTTGYNQTLTGSATSIATLSTSSNEAFRGIAFVPTAASPIPEPATATTLLATFALPLLLLRTPRNQHRPQQN